MIKTVNVKRDTLVGIYRILKSKKQGTFSTKFSFFILRNLKFLEEEINVIDEVNEQISKTLEPYNIARMSILTECSDKDEDGNPILINNNTAYKLTEHLEEFNEKILKLQEEHSESIALNSELKKQINELALECIDQRVLSISYENIPDGEFSIDELEIIMPLIKETEEELDTLLIG